MGRNKGLIYVRNDMGNDPHRMKGENVDCFSVKEENCLIMRWLLRFLSFLFHYFINKVRKSR